MTEPISLPPGVSFAILAFLLSLLPAGLFIWLTYLRRLNRPVPAGTVTQAFLAGMALVAPAFFFESRVARVWEHVSPATAHYFAGAVLPLQSIFDVLLPALGTFLVVAAVEEGLRYGTLAVWLRRSTAVDQVFDGIVLGIAMGLGFATVENTLYFLNLIREGSFDTLIFVFFLRFLISTLAHIGFGGVMGALLTRGIFQIYQPTRSQLLTGAFFIPWFLHGLYDLLLGINQTLYAVLVLLPPLAVLALWMQRPDFMVYARERGRVLVTPRVPVRREERLRRAFSRQFYTPWNRYAPWLHERRMRGNFFKDM
ncbi:MAG: hypothetical protein COT71_00300 [Candidatus Andersenbacteria bacterium CG10_big_fil_rev_8_21_14_0_10_54_11]|uniref:PrsW family intramembrane metalloprotease n=1 Tax=Candidatus Andersenbacteria bacterium CG10_big_fil_rev_8_21_14_0_10_54_11 TaxID=1974485 RepID=A0A2M6X0F5_9BACT|nr:MAG: hypothetical protein COT71_00300 [Candidatus Andersenbacteria bacterium CG10_big_fil_rev_8_21_14_0_10_54_11]